jgi:hypothetical protein
MEPHELAPAVVQAWPHRYNGTGFAILPRRRFENAFMLHKLTSAMFTGVMGLVLTCSLAHSQAQTAAPGSDQTEKRGTAERSAKTTGQTMTVTGCLQKDEKAQDEYVISGEDGKKWGLKSTSVKLADHMNHKVTVTGKVTKEGHDSEAGDLNVSNLKMVSPSCQ